MDEIDWLDRVEANELELAALRAERDTLKAQLAAKEADALAQDTQGNRRWLTGRWRPGTRRSA